eukprot:8718460-Alexandrium_andersonii.AAC.1
MGSAIGARSPGTALCRCYCDTCNISQGCPHSTLANAQRAMSRGSLCLRNTCLLYTSDAADDM